MPQMSPLWWMTMLMMTTTMIMFIITIKFHNKKNKMNKLFKSNSKTYWKW
uniref:ATP synthase F0 subunit 8 n=1 Tax=Olidiana longisticka TaxID=2816127 RepID=A0A898P981_9HEMI|nr:ATP synthase F0 subunit 8 [Olidiana longisticka]QSJ61359.1 ATP synthase F0 subunit 8 [Olidiana longisticka]